MCGGAKRKNGKEASNTENSDNGQWDDTIRAGRLMLYVVVGEETRVGVTCWVQAGLKDC